MQSVYTHAAKLMFIQIHVIMQKVVKQLCTLMSGDLFIMVEFSGSCNYWTEVRTDLLLSVIKQCYIPYTVHVQITCNDDLMVNTFFFVAVVIYFGITGFGKTQIKQISKKPCDSRE